ncbi:small ribosomal subunit protein bS6m isoform X1 [Loxodonta africana]|uniref:small ribosomal subunit protein bS6m isoform X1 n=1 Tax=Loxodonta africana TaxID=9785 RepID=UPI0030D29278
MARPAARSRQVTVWPAGWSASFAASPLPPRMRLKDEMARIHEEGLFSPLRSHVFGGHEPETAAALKRTIEALMDRGAIVRNLENLGERALPYKMSTHNQQHTRGGYFLVDFYAPTTTVESIMDHLSRDTDVIRPNVVRHPLTQEVNKCDGMVPVQREEKLYFMKKRK